MNRSCITQKQRLSTHARVHIPNPTAMPSSYLLLFSILLAFRRLVFLQVASELLKGAKPPGTCLVLAP